MASTGSGAPRRGTPTLTASDWAEAALQLIAEAGLGALTVSTLASRLGVTKGSFYWHFKGRPELLSAALARWEQRATTEAMTALDAVPDYRRRLQMMLDAAAQPPRARSLYAALAEAGEDPVVRQVLNRVATARIDYLEVCYRHLGFPPAVAKIRAVFAYAAYRGLLQLAREAPAALPDDWPTYARLVNEALLPAASPRGPKVRRATRKTARRR